MSATHLATCGSVGSYGRRVGTTYAYTPRSAEALSGEPWFRFRNAECERVCREAWAKHPPLVGDLFDVVDEGLDPLTGHSTRADERLHDCSLVKWERDGLAGARHFQQIGSTEFYRWYNCRDGIWWNPAGRLLRLNEAGRALLNSAKAEAA